MIIEKDQRMLMRLHPWVLIVQIDLGPDLDPSSGDLINLLYIINIIIV